MAGDDADGRNKSEDTKRGLLLQVVTALALSVVGFNIGACMSFSGIFADQMTSAGARPALSRSQISWVASAYAIGNIPGFLLSSYANPRLGTIRLVQLCAPVLAGGWLLLALGNSFWTMLAGRALTGIGVGTAFGPTITHIGEISSVNVRGALSVFLNVMISAGMLAIFLCGWQLDWRHTCLVVGIGPVVVMFLVTLMLPRSAKWLISKGHPVEEAQRSLRFYHGHDYDVDREIRSIRDSLGDQHKCDASLLDVLKLLKHRRYSQPFCIVLVSFIFFMSSGGFTTAAFAPVVFKQVGAIDNPYMGSIFVGVLRVTASVLSSPVMSKCERSTLMMTNGAVGGAACVVAGCFLFYSAALADYAWVSLVSILVIVGAMSFGIGVLTNVLLAELLPNAVRAELGGIVLLLAAVVNFGMLYAFPALIALLGMCSTLHLEHLT
ncbi:facilitated trehalose transporter Tret1-like [Amphibalanus amphitrite]|uniref:facilitated trehalose transporter Tret1-like n=1 Tax=Amphibalanus amphitrite TaxID=1232801 RepID=UPI001C928939|nr:facilitated trehalose transporter Tret1-like [Amphibalanus amphitrite]